METKIDADAVFADLRARGIEYEGDEEWLLADAQKRMDDAAERAADEHRRLIDAEALEATRAESGHRLAAMIEKGGESLGAEFWAEFGTGLFEVQSEEGDVEGGRSADMPIGEPSTPAAPAWLVVLDEESTSEPDELDGWINEALQAKRPKHRWTYAGITAHYALIANRKAILEARVGVFALEWGEAHTGAASAVNKFPSFVKSLSTPPEQEKKINALNEGRELFHPCTSGHVVPVSPLTLPKLPAWGKLPAVALRPPALQEIVSGARFASVTFGSDATLDAWSSDQSGDDVCCLSIEMSHDVAARFLRDEGGDPGAALHRSFRRRLERFLGPVSMAAVWVRSASSGSVVVFMMIKAPGRSVDSDLNELHRSNRFYKSLLQHRVVLPSGMPIERMGLHMASYLGLTEDEFNARRKDERAGLSSSCLEEDVVDYTPEAGFATEEQLAAHALRSRARWLLFTRTHGFPAWFDSRFVGFVRDYFMFSREHVRKRQKLKDALDNQRYKTASARRALKDRLALLAAKEGTPTAQITYFRASPALFAALASRSGEVLGEYCNSKHKAGRAKELYEDLRLSVSAPVTS